jgi:iron complex transport system substrate-binding protein
MKLNLIKLLLFGFFLFIIGCKQNNEKTTVKTEITANQIVNAKGLSIYKYNGYSIVKVNNPWPEANKNFTYVLKEKSGIIPDSLQKHTTISVPLQSVVVTSTTNIPFLEMLGVENKLKGFPHTDYISSEKTRKLIDNGTVKNVGQNENLNIEQLIEMSPELIVAFGVDNNNPAILNLEKSGLKVLIQGDWMEQSPLGKAEWIKLYGALFCKEKEATIKYNQIVKNYQKTLSLIKNRQVSSTVMYGSMYQDQWYVAKGDSWVSQFFADAKANYLWKDLKGSGSLALSFEQVFEKAQKTSVWITGTFKSLEDMKKTNPHYAQFEAFKNKKVYTLEGKVGAKGGVVFYELAPSRPDLVLKDYIKIFHPSLLPEYQFTFAKKID